MIMLWISRWKHRAKQNEDNKEAVWWMDQSSATGTRHLVYSRGRALCTFRRILHSRRAFCRKPLRQWQRDRHRSSGKATIKRRRKKDPQQTRALSCSFLRWRIGVWWCFLKKKRNWWITLFVFLRAIRLRRKRSMLINEWVRTEKNPIRSFVKDKNRCNKESFAVGVYVLKQQETCGKKQKQNSTECVQVSVRVQSAKLHES